MTEPVLRSMKSTKDRHRRRTMVHWATRQNDRRVGIMFYLRQNSSDVFGLT